MSELVERLSDGKHAVEVFRYESIDELESAVRDGLVIVRFTETQGGTELSVRLDDEGQRGDSGDEKSIHLKGTLTLDYVPVECEVTLDRKTLKGHGSLKQRSDDE